MAPLCTDSSRFFRAPEKERETSADSPATLLLGLMKNGPDLLRVSLFRVMHVDVLQCFEGMSQGRCPPRSARVSRVWRAMKSVAGSPDSAFWA